MHLINILGMFWQIEDPAPALKRLRDRRDLAALAAKPWAVEAAQQVSWPVCMPSE